LPTSDEIAQGRDAAYAVRYLRWRESHDRVFRRIALAIPEKGDVTLRALNLETAEFAPAEWPPEWSALHERLAERVEGGRPPGRMSNSDPLLLEFPRFAPAPNEPGMREVEWLVLELNRDYLAGKLLPELLRRHLGVAGSVDYDAEVVAAADRSILLYDSDPQQRIDRNPDASVPLLDIRGGPMGGRGGSPFGMGRGMMAGFGRGRGPGPGPRGEGGGPPFEPGPGRWVMLVRHRAGSLDALVARTRQRNLAVSGGLLLLLIATITLLVRYSRQAQQLAELQMNFVAGVSHELRTPLTVIRTAAYNLRGKLAGRPEQVERYGALIQAESEKLAALVEQVLRFASAQAGHVIRGKEPVDVESLIEEGLRSSRAALAGGSLTVEKHIDADLPPVLADGLALRHALQNLVDNALKYGTEGSNWLGVFARKVEDERGAAVEIRIADRGPGIPLDEQSQIFDPFFRGRRAVQDQVHGTGLGLNLVKKIVEAHGGAIRVESEPMRGAEFIVRIPAAPPELQDEFAHSVD
jgi:signal transduction histidine kinase